MVEYFWDSYAIIELVDGNKNYARFSQEPVFLSIFNLAEIYWSFIGEYSLDKADELYSQFKEAVIEIDDETMKEAIKFRKEHKKRDLSYTDCIGYIYAKRHKMKFLTGDNQFQDFDGVEFVK